MWYKFVLSKVDVMRKKHDHLSSEFLNLFITKPKPCDSGLFINHDSTNEQVTFYLYAGLDGSFDALVNNYDGALCSAPIKQDVRPVQIDRLSFNWP